VSTQLDQARLRQAAPFIVPVIILVAGWALLVRPQTTEKQRATRELASLRPRLESVRREMMDAPPPELKIEPARAFERQVTAGDPGRILEELSRLAPRTRYRNLSIDATGEQVPVRGAGGGPQVAGAVEPDPRFTLFNAALTYLPVTMSFDADYARVGELLWRLRDVGTIIEIRNVDIKRAATAVGASGAADAAPQAGVLPGDAPGPESDDLHVTLTLFAYARKADAAPAARPGSGAPSVVEAIR
jgi:hypothetical protein